MDRHVGHRPALAALMSLALVSAACSTGPGAQTTPGPTATSVAVASAGPTVGPTSGPTASPLPALELLWESSGDTEPSGFDPATYSPAIDPLTGDIWVALSFDSIIWIFSPDGTYKGSFGRPGKGDGEFNFVRPTCECGAGALAFAPDGSLFVADVGNQRVQKFDPAHEFVTAWGSFGAGEGQFADINQIVTDGQTVYVTDDVRRDTQAFDTSGKYLRAISPGGWLALDPDGNLYVNYDDELAKYDPAGKAVATFDVPDVRGAEAIGIAADGIGRVFFNYQRIEPPHFAPALGELDTTTKAYRIWSPGGETLAVDPSNEALYAANFTNPTWPSATLRKYAIPAP